MDNAWIKLLITSLLIAYAIQEKEDKRKVDPSRYISNWSQYGAPGEIEVGVLRQILRKIAEFKRTAYCPLGGTYDSCLTENLSAITSKIIKDSIKTNMIIPTDKGKKRLEEYILFLDDQTGRGLMNSTCTCTNKPDDWKSPVRKFECECVEAGDLAFMGLLRYKYIKINPEARKKPGFIRNKVIATITEGKTLKL